MKLITILFLFLIYFINITTTIDIMQEQCSCSCCIGLGCIPIQLPDFYVPLCADDDSACVTFCRMMYPAYCNHFASQTFAFCNSASLKTTNRCIFILLLILFYKLFLNDKNNFLSRFLK